MHETIATVCMSGSLETKLIAAARAGFNGIELFENDLIASRMTPREVRQVTDDLGLSIDLYQPLRDFENVDPTLLQRNLRRAEAKLDLAVELGAPMVLVCSNVATATVPGNQVAVEQLRLLGDLAHERGVGIAYEALAWGAFVSTYEHSWDLVREADHPAIGLAVDSFHILAKGSSLDALRSIPGDRIFFCQLADAPRMNLDLLSWSRHHRLFPGQGAFPLDDFVSVLLGTGYEGPLSVEVFNDVFRQIDPERSARDARRSLLLLQDSVRTADILDGVDAHPSLDLLPSGGPAEVFDFIEIRSDPDVEFESLLRALGFAQVGQHRSKAITLWVQGEVRLVIGAGDVAHGPRIAGLGFEFENAGEAAARAHALLAPSIPRSAEAGEQVFEIFSAPNGMEISIAAEGLLLDPDWVGEFNGSLPVSSGAIIDLDHVSVSQPWQHFDEGVLFFRGVLGLTPDPSVEVSDPSGLVRSQALRSRNGLVCVVLNVLPFGLLGEVGLSEQPADHLALRTDDLRATVRRLRREGQRLVKIPANYYDDLAVKFDRDARTFQELKELDIMYDEDDNGIFLQAYTETIGSVFFELVERVNDYRGFGAANSPVRRAAQRGRG